MVEDYAKTWYKKWMNNERVCKKGEEEAEYISREDKKENRKIRKSITERREREETEERGEKKEKNVKMKKGVGKNRRH